MYGIFGDDDPDHLPHFEISSSFAVPLLQTNLISIRFTVHAYAGGVHGSTKTETVNAILDPFTPLRLASIFSDLPKGVADLSNFCIDFLLKSPTYPHDQEWVKSGAAPEPRNFSKFNLTEEGLMITFAEYQIDCYAAGRSEVLVPYSVLGDNLNARIRSELSIGEKT